jgi:hypothetical protein
MDETRRPLYNQIIDMEAVELDLLINFIEERNGTVIQCNTDSITYYKENNKKQAVHFIYWDEQNKVQKYKYEDTHWLKCERKPRFQRYEKYEHSEPIWTV